MTHRVVNEPGVGVQHVWDLPTDTLLAITNLFTGYGSPGRSISPTTATAPADANVLQAHLGVEPAIKAYASLFQDAAPH